MVSNALSYFNKIYLINLDSRKDRLARSMNLFNKIGIADRVERFSAVRPPNGDGRRGCLVSHVNIIKRAKSAGLSNVLVFEDDVDLINLDAIPPAVEQLKHKDWALYYLGYNSRAPLNLSTPNLLHIKNCYSTHAIAYHSSVFDTILNAFQTGQIKIIDVWLSQKIQPRFACFGNYPIAALQAEDYSDVEKKRVNYSIIMSKFIENTRHITQ